MVCFDIDIVVEGEGEITVLELTNALANHKNIENVKGIHFKKEDGAQVNTGERSLMNIEELLPTPWELVDVDKYIYRDFYMRKVKRTMDIGQTSRGCPYNCLFCYKGVWGRGIRFRSSENVLTEIQEWIFIEN